MATATLHASIELDWTDSRGHDRLCDAEVSYTFDGDDLRITNVQCAAYNGYDDDLIDELVWERIADIAPDAFNDWQADRDDYLCDVQTDRAAESYIPQVTL